MQINGREIGPNQVPYIIAEISGNHRCRLGEAFQLIEAAKKAGADAVKFQCYEADDITLACANDDFVIKDGPWKGRNLYELYSKTQTPRIWFPLLADKCRKEGITWFASVFSPAAVDFLERLGCPAYKIASMEIVDIPLIKHTAKTGKPLIISTGMANMDETLDATRAAAKSTWALLHAISGYPTPISESNLCRLRELRYAYGISDHTTGWEIPVAAIALGACIIEKHIMLEEYPLMEGAPEDFNFSLRPSEFKKMTESVRQIWQAMQPSQAKSEESSRQLRRSLYVVKDIRRGDKFTTNNIRSIRPAYGLAPKHLPEVLDKTCTQDVPYGSALTWEMVEGHEGAAGG